MVSTVRFDDRVVLVTGAARGLGRAFAEAFAARGARLSLADNATDGAAAVAESIRSMGGNALAFECDVTDAEAVQRMVDDTLAAYGQLDAIVTNAGTIEFGELPAHPTPESLDAQIAVHLTGSANLIRSAWVALAAHGRGRIVNLSSGAFLGAGSAAAYAAAKAGVVGLSRSVAAAGEPVGIRANVLLPSAETSMQVAADELSITTSDDHAQRARVRSAPSDATAMALLLAHDRCPTTGEMFFNGRGVATRLFVATTRGLAAPDLTPERLLENWSQLVDEEAYQVPQDGIDFRSFFLARSAVGSAL